MSHEAGAQRHFGEGPLSRVTATIYTLLIIELLFLLTTAPGLVLLILLDRDPSNLPLMAGCALPLGPALSAALYALRNRSVDLTDLSPASAFWRGYRLNAGASLRIWVPLLVVLTIIGVSLTHRTAAGIPTWWAALLALIGALVSLCAVNALVITSLFTFRTRDVARLAAYFMIRTARVTVANACLLVVAAGITVLASEAVLMLLASVFVAALLSGCRPMIIQVREQFTV